MKKTSEFISANKKIIEAIIYGIMICEIAADFRPLHGLRHTFACVAVSNGVPLSHVQKLSTHKNPSLTQRYAHLEDSALKNPASLVGDFLGDVPGAEDENGS